MAKNSIEPHLVAHAGRKYWRVCVPESMRGDDGRSRRFFAEEKLAKSFARELNAQRFGLSGRFLSLAPADQSRLITVYDRVRGDLGALEEAVASIVSRLALQTKSLAVALDECLAAKRQAARRDVYLTNLELTLRQFVRGREDVAVAQVTPSEVTAWLNSNGWAGDTRLGYLSRLRSFFAWCSIRGYCTSNPCLAVERPNQEDRPPGILRVEECERLLTVCRERDPALLPYTTLALFGGIRPQEVQRIARTDVRDGHIHIQGAASKTRRRRLVETWDPLPDWLALGGELPPGVNFAKRWSDVRRRAEVNWSHDCLRHSFVSYALPLHGAAATAAQAGHSEAVLFAHYRELVTKADAEAFWALKPAA